MQVSPCGGSVGSCATCLRLRCAPSTDRRSPVVLSSVDYDTFRSSSNFPASRRFLTHFGWRPRPVHRCRHPFVIAARRLTSSRRALDGNSTSCTSICAISVTRSSGATGSKRYSCRSNRAVKSEWKRAVVHITGPGCCRRRALPSS